MTHSHTRGRAARARRRAPAVRASATRVAALAACVTAALVAGGSAAAAAESVSVSANWAGYAALPSTAAKRFSSVSGAWTVPTATCTAGRRSYSAVWVGLGGYRQGSDALEQIGSEADCSSTGGVYYSAWYELVPAGPVDVSMKVAPGDRLVASVAVRGHTVTLRLRNLTTGAHFAKTRRASTVDVSSAEWIVEAPSVCVSANACRTLALTDFGTVAFSSASATAGGHTGTISDPRWRHTELELRQSALASFVGHGRAGAGFSAPAVLATPSAVAGTEGAFSVTWSEQSTPTEQPAAPTLPGDEAGPT